MITHICYLTTIPFVFHCDFSFYEMACVYFDLAFTDLVNLTLSTPKLVEAGKIISIREIPIAQSSLLASTNCNSTQKALMLTLKRHFAFKISA